MRKDVVLEILADWNFWANREIETGIKRSGYVKELINLATKTNQIICIVGVRRAGKSYLMRQIAQELKKGDGSNTLIVNLEDERWLTRDLKLLREIYDVYLERVKAEGKPFIFLDEVQTIEGWERFVRGVHERNEANIFIAGSSSRLLSAELATLLTGRHIVFFVHPLCFSEFLEFKDLRIEKEIEIIAKRVKIKRFLTEYLEFGGFPEVALSAEKERLLLSYFETIIIRDTIDRFKIREKEKIKTLAKYYLTNTASLISFNKLSRFLNIPLTTVERFSSYLETASLIFFVRRFSYSLKEQEKSQRKVYSIDVGLSNAIGFRFSERFGRIIENVVAIELKKRRAFNPGIEVYYWRDYAGREVDFVIKEGIKVKELIQVCWDPSDHETREREVKALLKALDEFKLKKALVITEDVEKAEKFDDRVIIYKTLWKWLLAIENEKGLITSEDFNY
jgi:predicted AAA+ superfamily ATPase